MAIHPDVLTRGTNLANSISLAIQDSPFIATRYTGCVLEKDHLLTPELTDQGLREAKAVYPPLIMLYQLIVRIESNPISDLMIHSWLDPILAALTSLDSDIVVLDQNEVARRRVKETNDMIDSLTLNLASRESPYRINKIHPTNNQR